MITYLTTDMHVYISWLSGQSTDADRALVLSPTWHEELQADNGTPSRSICERVHDASTAM
jgi:hypothetical protein